MSRKFRNELLFYALKEDECEQPVVELQEKEAISAEERPKMAQQESQKKELISQLKLSYVQL